MGRISNEKRTKLVIYLFGLFQNNPEIADNEALSAVKDYFRGSGRLIDERHVKSVRKVFEAYEDRDYPELVRLAGEDCSCSSMVISALNAGLLKTIPDSVKQDINAARKDGTRKWASKEKKRKKAQEQDHQLSIDELPSADEIQKPSEKLPDGSSQTGDIETIYQRFCKEYMDPLMQIFIAMSDCQKVIRAEMNANHDDMRKVVIDKAEGIKTEIRRKGKQDRC